MIKANIELNRVLALPTNGVPEWLPLISNEKIITGRDGRKFNNPGATAVIAKQQERGVDVPFDVEHATELKAPQGDSAPAYGWITEYKEENGELWGKVDWTPKGKEALESKEYRYYSPAYRLSLPDRTIIFVKSIGLTNSPNLPLPALNHEEPEGGKKLIITPSILLALGLNSEASEMEVLSAIKKLNEKCELNSETTKNMIPKADYDTVLNRAETAETELNSIKKSDFDSRVTAAIDGAVKAGKIAPASKSYYTTTCNSEEALKNFQDHIGVKAPVIETNSETLIDGVPPEAGSTELNSEEKSIAEQMGLDDKQAKEFFGKGE